MTVEADGEAKGRGRDSKSDFKDDSQEDDGAEASESPFHDSKLGREMAFGPQAKLDEARSQQWRRLTDGLRRAITAGVELDASASELGELADLAQSFAESMEARATGRVVPLYIAPATAKTVEELLGQTMPFSPISGIYNPIAPPLVFEPGAGAKNDAAQRVIARVRYGSPHQGAPGLVHGAMISAAYDEVLALANMLAEASGPTARLTVRYRRPTPIEVDLRYEGWVEKTSELYTFTRGQCWLGDEMLTEAEGLFARIGSRPQQPASK